MREARRAQCARRTLGVKQSALIAGNARGPAKVCWHSGGALDWRRKDIAEADEMDRQSMLIASNARSPFGSIIRALFAPLELLGNAEADIHEHTKHANSKQCGSSFGSIEQSSFACALCAKECRNAKARNVRWRFKSTCARFAQASAQTRKHVTCDGVFKGTCARFAQASAGTRKHVTCDGVLRALVRALRKRVQKREST